MTTHRERACTPSNPCPRCRTTAARRRAAEARRTAPTLTGDALAVLLVLLVVLIVAVGVWPSPLSFAVGLLVFLLVWGMAPRE